MKELIKKLLKEGIYYHGTTLPKDNTTIDKFINKTGIRSNAFIGYTREVNSLWTFFTDSVDLARKFGSSKTDFYHDKANFKYKTVILKYEIDENKLNILDLTTEDYEFKLEKIGINLIKIYGIGMYDIEMMWELLDEDEYTNIIVNAGFNAVKLIENIGENYKGVSLAILTKIVNNVIKPLTTS